MNLSAATSPPGLNAPGFVTDLLPLPSGDSAAAARPFAAWLPEDSAAKGVATICAEPSVEPEDADALQPSPKDADGDAACGAAPCVLPMVPQPVALPGASDRPGAATCEGRDVTQATEPTGSGVDGPDAAPPFMRAAAHRLNIRAAAKPNESAPLRPIRSAPNGVARAVADANSYPIVGVELLSRPAAGWPGADGESPAAGVMPRVEPRFAGDAASTGSAVPEVDDSARMATTPTESLMPREAKLAPGRPVALVTSLFSAESPETFGPRTAFEPPDSDLPSRMPARARAPEPEVRGAITVPFSAAGDHASIGRSPLTEKFAAAATTTRSDTGRGAAPAEEEKCNSAHDTELAAAPARAGIDGAPVGAMPAAATSAPAPMASPAAGLLPAPEGAHVGRAAEAVALVMEQADRLAAGGGESSMQLQLGSGESALSIRVHVRGGELHTTLATASEELRGELAREWQLAAPSFGERALRVVPPVFAGGGSAGGEDAGRERRAPQRPWEPEPKITSAASSPRLPAAAMPDPRAPALRGGSRRLHLFA